MNTIRRFDQTLPHGITLACRAAGEGRVRAILLHGFPEAAFVWDEVMARLAPRVATVAARRRRPRSAPTAPSTSWPTSWR
jgi:hypothetical protein